MFPICGRFYLPPGDIATPPSIRPSVCSYIRPSRLVFALFVILIECCLIYFKMFLFSSRLMLLPTLKKIIGVNKYFGGGGGVLFFNFFLDKQFFLISRFMLFSTLKNIILKSAPSLTG